MIGFGERPHFVCAVEDEFEIVARKLTDFDDMS
jgi:hypothetical protein